MRRIGTMHLVVEASDGGDWKKLAAQVGATREELWAANGMTGYRPMVAGETLHVPFVP